VKKLGEGRTILILLLLGFALYFVVTALGYGRNSRIFPMAIGIPTVILLALAFIGVWKPGLLRGAEVDFGAPSGGALSEPEEAEEGDVPAMRVVRMLGWLFFALASIALVGFSVAVPIYILLFGRIEGRARWRACTLTALVSWAFIVGYFDLFMKFKMFRGVLFGDQLPLL
jgi:hypothetical protein